MIPYSNTTPQSWSEFAAWLRGLKLDGVLIEHHAEQDEVIIRNTNTKMIQRVSRFALEHMDPALRQETFLQMIANTMKTPTEIIKDQMNATVEQAAANVLSGIYSPNPAGYTAGGGIGFGNVMRGAIGAPVPVSVEDYYNQIQSNDKDEQLKSRLFSDGEREELRQLKQKVRNYYIKYRSTEEMVYLFNTAQIVIAGGCFASLLNGEDVKDYDVFLLDYESNRQVAQMMIDKYHTDDFDLSEGVRNNDVRIGNSNYMNNDKIEQTILFKNSRMQYITTRYKTREELVQHFDFKHCCVSYDLSNDKLFITRQVYDLIKSRTLVPNNVNNTPAQWRYEKFLSRGWTKPEIMFL